MNAQLVVLSSLLQLVHHQLAHPQAVYPQAVHPLVVQRRVQVLPAHQWLVHRRYVQAQHVLQQALVYLIQV